MEIRKGPDTRRKCPICRRRYDGSGRDAIPVWPGRCCERCYRDYVVPMKMQLLRQSNEENEKNELNNAKIPQIGWRFVILLLNHPKM